MFLSEKRPEKKGKADNRRALNWNYLYDKISYVKDHAIQEDYGLCIIAI